MRRSSAPDPGWPDERLVESCLGGNEEAWEALVDKYGQLVYSIARRFGATTEEAADLSQAVWLDAYNDLRQLRKRQALRSWLISLARHRCYHWKLAHRRREERAALAPQPEHLAGPEEITDGLDELEQDQMVRQAILSLPPRCREMIDLLFFHQPPTPYRQVAARLGLATGSIGFIRGRCLQRLRRALDAMGVR